MNHELKLKKEDYAMALGIIEIRCFF